MLDQNTDRMWFVIGAVIVGAAIIFIANGTLPDIFASVTNSFEESSAQAMDVIADTHINQLISGTLEPSGISTELVNYENGVWTLRMGPNSSNYSTGLAVVRETVHIPYGKQFNVSYEVFSPKAVTASTDVNARASEGASWRSQDNDDHATRRFNGVAGIEGIDYSADLAPFKFLDVPAGEWTTITFSYVNTSEENINQVPIYDYSRFGVRNTTGSDLEIQMRNVRGWVSDPTD